ncbi:MAG TPA: 4Fe-4S binding protein [Nitrospirota bacterium]|nr:4Fe-4S binding protein [Nitrospirota bacterium]
MTIRTARRIVQAASLVFIIAIPVLNRNGIDFITGSFYSLAVGPVWISDPLIALQTILLTLHADAVLLVSLVIPLALAFVLGRAFCGWVCPQNALSEFVDWAVRALRLRRFIPQGRTRLPRYLVLAAVIILTPFAGIPLASLLSAPGIISVQTAKLIYEGTVGVEVGLIGLIVLTEFLVVRRVWCAHVCPIGTFLGMFRTGRTLTVTFASDKEHVCDRCMDCMQACQFGLDPTKNKLSSPCHNCGDCIDACRRTRHVKSPLHYRF